jgi:hypothetical protein
VIAALVVPSLQRTIALRVPTDPSGRFSNRTTASTICSDARELTAVSLPSATARLDAGSSISE